MKVELLNDTVTIKHSSLKEMPCALQSRIMSPSVDVLTRTKTQPKKLPDKKSDFLKQLKKEKPLTNGDLKSAADKEVRISRHQLIGVCFSSIYECL